MAPLLRRIRRICVDAVLRRGVRSDGDRRTRHGFGVCFHARRPVRSKRGPLIRRRHRRGLRLLERAGRGLDQGPLRLRDGLADGDAAADAPLPLDAGRALLLRRRDRRGRRRRRREPRRDDHRRDGDDRVVWERRAGL